MRNLVLPLLILVAVLLVGCKTSRRISESPVLAMQSKDDRGRFEELLTNFAGYRSFSTRVNLSVKMGSKSFSSSGTLKIIRDEIIWFSLQPALGIEVARIMVTPDSLFVLSTLNQQYAAESLEKYKKKLPLQISLAMVESLFLNRIFISGEEPLTPDDYRKFRYTCPSADLLEISPKREKGVKSLFKVDNQNQLTETVLSVPQNQLQLTWAYNQFGKNFPVRSEVELKHTDSGKSERASFSYSRIEWNKVTDLKTKISSRYTQVPIETLIESLKNR